ncbi:hypothetical protein [Arthrobacter crystallopoietes]|uniref:hypothetical protein n=1 Tax=Crystallibacter crystallopoietes TaxID=37928 RepID=UPI001ABDA349|nr:hypothetical protein [Arthrobacter crystallopoietes]QTG83247.1 hypothetical protein J5251_12405 [Arthrobacter crystallopoietes]
MFDQVRSGLAPGQPDRKIAVEAEDGVVPAVGCQAQAQAGQVWELLGEQAPDQLLGHIDVRSGHEGHWTIFHPQSR